MEIDIDERLDDKADELARKIDALCTEYPEQVVYMAIAMIIGRSVATSLDPDPDNLTATISYLGKHAERYFDEAMAEMVMEQFLDGGASRPAH